MAPTNRIRQAERELARLSLLIDGRHARDGKLTWTMIADTVEQVWRLLHAELTGAADTPPAVSPVRQRSARTAELQNLAQLAGQLEARLVRLAGTGGSVQSPLRMPVRTGNRALCRVDPPRRGRPAP